MQRNANVRANDPILAPLLAAAAADPESKAYSSADRAALASTMPSPTAIWSGC